MCGFALIILHTHYRKLTLLMHMKCFADIVSIRGDAMKRTLHTESIFISADTVELRKKVTEKVEKIINHRLRKENGIAESRDILPAVHRGQGQNVQ